MRTKDDAFNVSVDEWWRARWTMAEKIEVWQQTFRDLSNTLTTDDAEHYAMELLSIYEECVVPVEKQWAQIFTYAASRGSSFRYREEFVPEWFVGKHALYVVRTHKGDIATTPVLSGQVRFALLQCSNPAWVFETICMKYLQYTCLQVLAFLRGVDNDLDEAMRYSNLAMTVNDELVHSVLPLYFAPPAQKSSFLLSKNFHESYLAAHLQAQNDQILAIKCSDAVAVTRADAEVIKRALYGALLLLRACKLLGDASSTFYDDLGENYIKAISHSRCCAHFLLASAFWMAYKQDVAITLCNSTTPLFIVTGGSSQVSIDNRCLAMNAFYCIRSALVQTPVVPATLANFYVEVASDLSSNYCMGTPPYPLINGVSNASENDSIIIHGRIADDVECTQVNIMHPQTSYIDIGFEKRFTLSMQPMKVE